MKILVTGANGYIGSHVVDLLISKGHEVVACDINTNHINPQAQVIKYNVFDCSETDDAYSLLGKPDVCIHFAWRDGFVHNSPNHIVDLPMHYEFLRKLIEGGVKHLAVMGSMHEIGFFEGSINEATPCNPQSLYGISKNALRRALELLVNDSGCVFQWLRGFYIVGNTEDGSSIFSKIVRSAHEGREKFPFTMGLNQFDFLDYDIFCKYVADSVEQTEISGIINICSGRPERLADRVEQFIRDNGFKIKLEYGAFPDRPYDSKAIWGDDFKIRMIERIRNGVAEEKE